LFKFDAIEYEIDYKYFANIVMKAFCNNVSFLTNLYADFETASEIAQNFTKSW
jgi:hypothetical protein